MFIMLQVILRVQKSGIEEVHQHEILGVPSIYSNTFPGWINLFSENSSLVWKIPGTALP